MISDQRFIIIAGTGRNVGKTTFACRLINTMSTHRKVIGLKWVSLKKDGYVHNHHQNIKKFEILKETHFSGIKDTSKMLNAGASESYLVVSYEADMEEALNSFFERIDPNSVVVTESASLRNWLIPQVFVIIDRKEVTEKKSYIDTLIPLANYFVEDAIHSDLVNLITKKF